MTTATMIVLAVNAVILFVAAIMTVVRIARGPRALDRIVASDVLVAIVVAAIALIMVWRDSGLLMPVVLVLSLLGFIGAVAMARLIRTRRDLHR